MFSHGGENIVLRLKKISLAETPVVLIQTVKGLRVQGGHKRTVDWSARQAVRVRRINPEG